MSASPVSVKLTCRSWQQLAAIHSRDLSRGAFFLKTTKPPPLGTSVRISLTLPSGSTVELLGLIQAHIDKGGLGGRGPGIDLSLQQLPQSVMWLIESALRSAGITPVPLAPPHPEEDDEGDSIDIEVDDSVDDDIPLEEGHELVEAEEDLVQALWKELGSLSKLNAFQVLEVGYDCSDEEVRASFAALSQRYHPDRFVRYDSFELRELANEVFILLRDAYQSIGNSRAREATKKKLGIKPTFELEPPPLPPPKPVAPPPSPQRPKTTSPAARANARPAVPKVTPPPAQRLPPTPSRPADKSIPDPTGNDSTKTKLALANRMLDSGNYEQAIQMMRVESRRNRDDVAVRAVIELAEGLRAMASGDRMEAAQRFEAALELDPTSERAAKEIAEMRRRATNQRKGLLSKLMKKD